jgi:hypothetical protein
MTLAVGLTASSPTHSQILDLDSLKSVQRGLQVAKRDLMELRAHQEKLADSLSRAISLHEQQSASGELIETLIRATAMGRALDALSQQREELESKEDTLRPDLRAAYDWEISRLFTELHEQPDEGLLLQLTVFQEERKALGDEIVDSQMRYGEDMALSDADGPDEIFQKIELLEGMASGYSRRAQLIARRLRTLEKESRLARTITMRSRLSPREAARPPATRSPTHQLKGVNDSGSSGLLPEVAHLQESRSPSGSSIVQATTVRRELNRGTGRSFSLDLEIEKWKVREREVVQIQSVVQERIAVFRLRLEELLDGEEQQVR